MKILSWKDRGWMTEGERRKKRERRDKSSSIQVKERDRKMERQQNPHALRLSN